MRNVRFKKLLPDPLAAFWPFAAAALLLILPLWLVQSPAMPDYPAHLASFYLIGGDGASALSRFYHVRWAFVPNLGSEILVPLLARLTGLVPAAKLFLSMAIAMWVLGPALIHRALFGRLGLGPLVAALFAYNANFMWSFFNYYFAAGLSFLIFAAWIAARRRGAFGVGAIVLFALAVTALYFCHIFAAAALMLLIAGYELAENRRDAAALGRAAAIVSAVYLPAAFCFLCLKPGAGSQSGLAFNYADTWQDRLGSILLRHFDAPSYLVPALLLAGLAALLLLGRARLHPALGFVLALLLLGSILAPEFAMGGWGVDLRLPAMFASLLFAAAHLRVSPVLGRAATPALLALFAWNAATLTRDWRHYDRQFAEFRAAMNGLPRGARLFTVLDGDALGDAPDQIYWHMAEYSVIDRGDFTALMFATKGQHVVQLNAPVAPFAAQSAQEGSPPDIADLDDLSTDSPDADPQVRADYPYLKHFQCHFDLALVIGPRGPRQVQPAMLRLRHAGSFFSLNDVRPGPDCAAPPALLAKGTRASPLALKGG